MAYIVLSSRCAECMWLNCCEWVLHRDQSRCKNHLNKKKYLAMINGEQYEEPKPSENPVYSITKKDVEELLAEVDE